MDELVEMMLWNGENFFEFFDCFEKEARNIGLGTKLAMKRFDDLCAGFSDALKGAAKMKLLKQ